MSPTGHSSGFDAASGDGPRPGSAARLRVSVVVPTRNRAAHARACAQAILATLGFDELLIVDQSDGLETKASLSTLDDPRLRYLATETRGVTHGRNLGMALSHGDIIAFTDDDCRVAPDWAARLVTVFESEPRVGVVCGRVQVPPELQSQGWAESFHPQQREWRGRFPPIGEWGITANMSIRRSILESVGVFDPMLGAGAPLRSGGEPDFLFRVLRGGFTVINADEVVVDHLGVRKPGAEATRLIRGYGIGTAAAFMKHIRLGDAAAAGIYLRFVGSTGGLVLANTLKRGRPIGAGFLLALMMGGLTSFKYKVDAQHRTYVER